MTSLESQLEDSHAVECLRVQEVGTHIVNIKIQCLRCILRVKGYCCGCPEPTDEQERDAETHKARRLAAPKFDCRHIENKIPNLRKP